MMMDWNWPGFPPRLAHFIETGNVEYSYNVDPKKPMPPIFMEDEDRVPPSLAIAIGVAILFIFAVVIYALVQAAV